MRNKKYFVTKSWKCAQHAQNGPTSQKLGWFQHLEISKYKLQFSVSWTRLWHDFTLCPLRIRSWSFKMNYRWYLELQLLCRWYELILHGLVERTLSNGVVRLWSRVWWSSSSGRVADRRQAQCAKWSPYAVAAPAGQTVAATTSPRAPQLAYLVRPRSFASSVPSEPSSRFRLAAGRVAAAQLARLRVVAASS